MPRHILSFFLSSNLCATLQRRLVLQFSLGTLGHALGKVLLVSSEKEPGLRNSPGCCARLDQPWIYVRPLSCRYERTRPSPLPVLGSLLVSIILNDFIG